MNMKINQLYQWWGECIDLIYYLFILLIYLLVFHVHYY